MIVDVFFLKILSLFANFERLPKEISESKAANILMPHALKLYTLAYITLV